jgi:RNA polymerase sigma factor (sigma-70 family)
VFAGYQMAWVARPRALSVLRVTSIPHALARERVSERLHRSDLERVVAHARAGDPTAWSDLVGRFRAHVIRVARAHGLSAHDAEDVVQETWLRLFRNLHRVRDARALGGWLTTTARRESLRLLESGKREHPSDADLGAGEASPEDPERELLNRQRSEAVARALQSLPARHQMLMRALLAEPAPSYGQISDQLGIPIGSIGPIRGRCLARLRGDEALRAATVLAE